MKKTKRITVSIDTDVCSSYERMSEVSGLSLSRCIGEWLADTVESAQFITAKLEDVKLAPTRVFNELLASAEQVKQATLVLKGEVRAARSTGTPAARAAARPPSSNTGVKGRRAGGRNAQ